MMESRPVRVLHYIKHLESGGGEVLMTRLCEKMDREKIQFDFLVHTKAEELLDAKVKALGGRKVVLFEQEATLRTVNVFRIVRNLWKILSTKEYRVFHIHCSTGFGLVHAAVARWAGVPVVVTHIHNSSFSGGHIFLRKACHLLCKLLFSHAPTDRVACSAAAAGFLYSKRIVENGQYMLLKNGIDCDRFRFRQDVRDRLRKELNWNDKVILLNVGRLEDQKNQRFLMDVFKRLSEESDDYRLLIVGRGALRDELIRHAQELGISSKLCMVDYSDRIEDYYFAADAFVFPSIEEGLGIAAIEAQASGLPVIASDGVPREASVTDRMTFVPLADSAETWAKAVASAEVAADRTVYADAVRESGYDIARSAAQLQDFYEDKLRSIQNER